MSDRIKDLLHEVADGVDPGERLDAIRAETSGGRRTGRGWWAAGGVGYGILGGAIVGVPAGIVAVYFRYREALS